MSLTRPPLMSMPSTTSYSESCSTLKEKALQEPVRIANASE